MLPYSTSQILLLSIFIKSNKINSISSFEESSIANMTLEMAASMSDEEKEERFVKAEETMKNAGADYVIRTMRELPKVIEEINRRMQETIQ